jgi:succinate dehydrogenase / fumarate reductase cytochrome b subunit
VATDANRSLLAENEFLIRRLHSLTGLIPVGAYMVVHLTTNLTLWDRIGGPSMFQTAVYQIHSLRGFLPFVEWTFILLPILFHAILGLVIIRGGFSNSGTYGYAANVRYTLQRTTGIIAFLFILYHVFHLHGWFHFEAWKEAVAYPLGGAQFKPYSAASTLASAMQGVVVPVCYAVGVLACVFHFANGIWTMGITWGVWTSPSAQQRAGYACAVLGVGLAFVGMGALTGAVTVDPAEAVELEVDMAKAKVESGEIPEALAREKLAKEHISALGLTQE